MTKHAQLDMGFPGGAAVKSPPANAGDMRHRFDPRVRESSLEKETTVYSSVSAWKIPWTEESGGQQSMGSQKS